MGVEEFQGEGRQAAWSGGTTWRHLGGPALLPSHSSGPCTTGCTWDDEVRQQQAPSHPTPCRLLHQHGPSRPPSLFALLGDDERHIAGGGLGIEEVGGAQGRATSAGGEGGHGLGHPEIGGWRAGGAWRRQTRQAASLNGLPTAHRSDVHAHWARASTHYAPKQSSSPNSSHLTSHLPQGEQYACAQQHEWSWAAAAQLALPAAPPAAPPSCTAPNGCCRRRHCVSSRCRGMRSAAQTVAHSSTNTLQSSPEQSSGADGEREMQLRGRGRTMGDRQAGVGKPGLAAMGWQQRGDQHADCGFRYGEAGWPVT